MELRQLEYFIAVCEEMHFSRASEKLCTTQSNLSQQIKLLESELGVPLFDRMGKRIAMTEAGKVLLEQSRHVFSHLAYARDAIAEMKNVQGGTLTIGVLPGDADLLFDALLVEFHRTYPQLSLSVIESTKVLEQVISGTIDIGVTTTPPPAERMTVLPLFHEEFALAIRADHPLAKEKAIPFAGLQHLKMVMFPPDHQVRQVISRYCLQEGFRLQPHIETTTLSSLLTLVEQGIGACVLPRLLLENLNRKEIAIISLLDPTPCQDICIVHRSDRYMGFAARTFIDTLTAYIQTAIAHTKKHSKSVT
ncbi:MULTISPECIES: LysR family transcriptional regulator [Brevibacillus]|jgi:DNA-binding transcriptional LysR family regulator|uniref:LysR family transcriptional regulator n=1 Tax=Brevibacillus TaxID=55080 RepID=UPI000469D0B3|nr:LysR family transcriptional regulator [Brevibacillus borstelensis]KKX56475.1 transcriptional regulator [Brevibacillus borstelensis cifa_chp40]MBE5398276.1 LysR family transcriptional regulator [Brevibacillus borstelensis]MCC0564760.1 LysR family transcriptional regulator [Brevibacillus borstelensis]MCM3621478.1 LysR family transcriptional regulator [Brevibacillus borstelensis]MED1742719.1 LysR family transcriptional regulator [Brevibacillus borstelensis]